MNSLSVFGLGKLGAPLACWLAERGFRVYGVDTNPAVVADMTAGVPHILEPGYPALLAAVKDKLTATTSALLAVQHSDAALIIVPTPSNEDGRFQNDFVLAACQDIAGALVALPEKRYLVIVVATVMPGSCAGVIRDALPDNCGLAYSPEFVALGEVLAGFACPDLVLLGADDDWSMERAQELYRGLYPGVPLHTMSLVSAELAKLALNAYVTLKMTFANEIGRLCARIPGADVDAILGALGDDKRIGRAYLRAGASWGGPCFPRDNRALVQAGEDAGVFLPLPAEVDDCNQDIPHIVADLVRAHCPTGHVGILGLSYKPGTALTEESLGAGLCTLLAGNYFVSTYDPLATLPGVTHAEDLFSLLFAADCIVVTQDRPEWHDLLPLRRGQVFIDCWRILHRDRIEAAGGVYVPLWRKL